MNGILYKQEMKSSLKILLIFAAVLTLYISVIVSMYDPELTKLLDGYVELMPELMAAVGMTAGASSLLEFLSSYLYGFILLIFPMLFCIFRGNSLICRYVDRRSAVWLVAAPVKRRTVAVTQMAVLVSGIGILVFYSTVLEIGCAQHDFPGALDIAGLLMVNAGLFCLQLWIGSICFLASCIFSDTRYSVGIGAGIPILMYVLQMLSNIGGKAEKLKYLTFFTLFDPDGMIAGDGMAAAGAVVLFIGAVVLFGLGALCFSRRDLHI